MGIKSQNWYHKHHTFYIYPFNTKYQAKHSINLNFNTNVKQSSLPISSLIKISSKDLNQYHDEHNYQAQSTSNTKLSNCIKLHQYQVLYQLEVLFQLWGLGEQSGFMLSFSSFSLLVVVD